MLLDTLANDPDLEWLMIDSSYVKVHQHGTGAVGGNQAVGRTKSGLTTKLHLAVDAHGMPIRMLVTAGTVTDCTRAEALLDGIAAERLLSDRGYDTNAALAAARERGMVPVIPPKRNRKVEREYDRALYQVRHLVENGFGKLKEWRGDALCAECGFLPGDMPDTRPGTVG